MREKRKPGRLTIEQAMPIVELAEKDPDRENLGMADHWFSYTQWTSGITHVWWVWAAWMLVRIQAREPVRVSIREPVDLAKMFLHSGLVNVDPEHAQNADLSKPILIVPIYDPENPEANIVIDGWHRLWLADHQGREFLWGHFFTEPEARLFELCDEDVRKMIQAGLVEERLPPENWREKWGR